MEAQTENAFKILDGQVVSVCIISKECQPNTFSIYVADNIDRNEETVSGMNKSSLLLTSARIRDNILKKYVFLPKFKISFVGLHFLLHGRILKFHSVLQEFSYLIE